MQKSIKDSVHQLLQDWIQRLDVGPMFHVLESEIWGPGGSLCVFRGMNDQNAESIKSMEGFVDDGGVGGVRRQCRLLAQPGPSASASGRSAHQLIADIRA